MRKVVAFYIDLNGHLGHIRDPKIRERVTLPWVDYLLAMQATVYSRLDGHSFHVLTDKHTGLPGSLDQTAFRFDVPVADDVFKASIRLQDAFVRSDAFDGPTILTGADVLFLRNPWSVVHMTCAGIIMPHWYMPMHRVSWINSLVLLDPQDGVQREPIRDFFAAWRTRCDAWKGEWPDLNSLTMLLGFHRIPPTAFYVKGALVQPWSYGRESGLIMSAKGILPQQHSTAVVDFNGGAREKARLLPLASRAVHFSPRGA